MKPTINGFSIKSLKTMETYDGYAISCTLYRGTKNLGRYFHAGDGGEGRLENWRTHIELNEEMEKWKKDTPIDLGDGRSFSYGWDVDRLIEELIVLEDRYKSYKKALKKGYSSVVVINSDSKPYAITVFCRTTDKEAIGSIARNSAEMHEYEDYSYSVYSSDDDFKKEVPNG